MISLFTMRCSLAVTRAFLQRHLSQQIKPSESISASILPIKPQEHHKLITGTLWMVLPWSLLGSVGKIGANIAFESWLFGFRLCLGQGQFTLLRNCRSESFQLGQLRGDIPKLDRSKFRLKWAELWPYKEIWFKIGSFWCMFTFKHPIIT